MHETSPRTRLIPPGPLSRRAVLAGGAGLAGLALLGAAPPSRVSADDPVTVWQTVWEDRFTGGALDTAAWTAYDSAGQYDLRDQQWNDPSMVTVEGDRLVLRAQAVPTNGFGYRAGTISTKGKVALGPHGRLTTRQYVRPGVGVSIGVCLFGTDIDTVGWPACGEIDATELALARPGSPFGSAHGPGYSGDSPISSTYTGPLDTLVGRWVDHVLDWTPGHLSWAIDGVEYASADASDPRAAGGWPFDAPFFVVLTTTVGSWSAGDPDTSTWPLDENGVPTGSVEFDFIRFEQELPC